MWKGGRERGRRGGGCEGHTKEEQFYDGVYLSKRHFEETDQRRKLIRISEAEKIGSGCLI